MAGDKKPLPKMMKTEKPEVNNTLLRAGKPETHVQQATPATTVYKPPPGVVPCPSPAPAPTGEPNHLELIQQIIAEHETFRQILVQLTAFVQSVGTAQKPEVMYYNTSLTAIQVATPVQPNSPDTFSVVATGTPGYQAEGVYNAVQRISPRITVINDGSESLFVISTPDNTNWSNEAAILAGEARTFFNVWELRLRSPIAGNLTNMTGGIYRVTEYDFWLAYSVTPNRSLFTARRVAVPFPAPGSTLTTLLGVSLLIPNGFTLVVRSNVANAAGSFVFVAGPLPAGVPPNPPVDAVTNVGVATTRNTLAPGDSVRLFVRSTDDVAILGSVAGLFADILVEQ